MLPYHSSLVYKQDDLCVPGGHIHWRTAHRECRMVLQMAWGSVHWLPIWENIPEGNEICRLWAGELRLCGPLQHCETLLHFSICFYWIVFHESCTKYIFCFQVSKNMDKWLWMLSAARIMTRGEGDCNVVKSRHGSVQADFQAWKLKFLSRLQALAKGEKKACSGKCKKSSCKNKKKHKEEAEDSHSLTEKNNSEASQPSSLMSLNTCSHGNCSRSAHPESRLFLCSLWCTLVNGIWTAGVTLQTSEEIFILLDVPLIYILPFGNFVLIKLSSFNSHFSPFPLKLFRFSRLRFHWLESQTMK